MAAQYRNHHDRQRPPEKTLQELWPSYLQDGYFDVERNLKPEYVSREKVQPLVKAMNDAKPKLTNGQLRRFFQHCRAIEAKLKANTSTWNAQIASVKKLDIAAADAYGKSKKKIPTLFHDFIKSNVTTIKTEDDFLKGFLPHFEALVGFGSQHLHDHERN